MKARTCTLLVTITDPAPPSPEALAVIVARYLEEGCHGIKAVTVATVDAIEGTRPLPALVQRAHAAIVREAGE